MVLSILFRKKITDDERQIKRGLGVWGQKDVFEITYWAMCKKWKNLMIISIACIRQALQHWGYQLTKNADAYVRKKKLPKLP